MNEFMKKVLSALMAVALIGWALYRGVVREDLGPAVVVVKEEAAALAPAEVEVAQGRAALRTMPVTVPEPSKPLFARILAGEKALSSVGSEALAAFLERSRTNAQSLVAAYQVTRDVAWLRMAATSFPSDPEVLFNVVAHNAFPENRREWLDRLKEAMPENALGNYLSAREHFKNMQSELAVQDLVEARAKGQFHEFTADKLQGLEDLYLATGKPAAEAKALAMANVLLPHLKDLRNLSKDLGAAQAAYISAGDYEGARKLALAGIELGHHLSRGNGARSILNQMVGLVIEGEAVGQLPADQWGGATSLADYRAAVEQEKARVRQASKMFEDWASVADDAQMISYFDRAKLYGEPAALAWLANSLQR